MRGIARLVDYLLTAQLAASAVFSYSVPPGSPGFYHGNSSAAVTFDAHSMFLDDKRLYLFSGEVHAWRMPSGPAMWRDVFQKMKAAGFNGVSVYHHWGLSEGKAGSLDFLFYRSHTEVYEVAKEVGLLVTSRPGPYINASRNQCSFIGTSQRVPLTDRSFPAGGGFPGWLTNVPAEARTNQTGYTDAWTPYIEAVARFAEPYQYPDGPIIVVQSENEFFQSTSSEPGRSEYMVLIENTSRNNGITKVPLSHNDASPSGQYAHGLGQVDLYLWDSYPQGFDCANPSSWPEQNSASLAIAHQAIIPDVMWGSGEFQAGAFDPWGGSGYDQCFDLTNEQFANTAYKNNLAAQTTYQNLYMTFGGTNWGNLAEPTVYTSYDYGAPIREDRTLSSKYSEIKLQTNFLHASPDFLVATRFGNGTVGSGTSFSDNSRIYTTALSAPSGAHFYIIRQNSVTYTTAAEFTIEVNTTSGPLTVPRFSPNATLDARESQIIVSQYLFGSHALSYSTAEIFTWSTISGIDYLVLYAQQGHSIEVVVTGFHSAINAIKIGGSTSIFARGGPSNTLIITGTPSSITTVSAGNVTVLIADKHTALSFWNVRLPSSSHTQYDQAPDVPSVLVLGPYLVRNATLDKSGSTLAINGDLNATTTLDVIGPSTVKAVTWNGLSVKVEKSQIGTLRGQLGFSLSLSATALPSLKNAVWECADSLPEVQPGFDDSAWVDANKTSTARPYPPLGGKFVLYADEYGFHQGKRFRDGRKMRSQNGLSPRNADLGNIITRGHFTGKNATGVRLIVQGGYNFGYSAWINANFLGSSQGTNQYSADGGIDMTNMTWSFNASDLSDGDNVVTVVVDQTGLEEDYNGQDTFKTPRGVRGYALLSTGNTAVDFTHWKIQGNLGGEDFPDKVRGPLNEGGLFVERQGAHLPNFPTTSAASGWISGSSSQPCTPYTGISKAGIQAFRTTFNLSLPATADVPVALKFTRTPSSSYRSVVYVNGWQFGRFNSRDGPQEVFPLPEGILNHRGKNELMVTLWSLDAEGAKMEELELVNTALVSSSKEVIPGIVESPGYFELRG
ncbi:glycoside hydrolase family 35 protein [Cytidiella melzeri]|nr:glycoside hydrolase family 35 protein [Cytidiella melzeri]